jgi:hypothetical protein
MNVLNYKLSNVNVNVDAATTGKVSVTPSLAVKSVNFVDLTPKQKVLRIAFKGGFTYAPGSSAVMLEGHIDYILLPKEQAEYEKELEKTKKLPQAATEKALSNIFSRVQTQSFFFAREAGLPSPIPMPKLKVEAKK